MLNDSDNGAGYKNDVPIRYFFESLLAIEIPKEEKTPIFTLKNSQMLKY